MSDSNQQHKSKVITKVLAYLQLFLVLISLLAPVTSVTAFADDSDSSSSSSSSSSDSSSDSSSSSSSSSDDDNNFKSTNPKMTAVEKKIGTKNNIMNPSFANAARNAAFADGGVLTYSPKMQTLLGYTFLRSAYGDGSNYKDVTKTGKDSVSSLNSVLPDYKMPGVGTDSFVSALTSGTGGKEQKATENISKADKIATSSFPTDMSKDAVKKWTEGKGDLYNVVSKSGTALGDNFMKAVSLSDSRDPGTTNSNASYSSGSSTSASDGSIVDQLGSGLDSLGKGISSLWSSGKNLVSGNLTGNISGGDWYATYSFKDRVGAWSAGQFESTGGISWQLGTHAPASSKNSALDGAYGEGSDSGKFKSSVENAYIAALAADLGQQKTYSKINSKSDLENYLSKFSAMSAGQLSAKSPSDKFLYGSDIFTGSNSSVNEKVTYTFNNHNEGSSEALLQSFMYKKKTATWSDMISAAKKLTPVILPSNSLSAITAVNGKLNSSFAKNYLSNLNKKNKVTISDDEWASYEKFRQNDQKQTDAAQNATKNVSVVSFSPIIPYDPDEWTSTGSLFDDNNQYGANGVSGGFITKSDGYNALTGSDFSGGKGTIFFSLKKPTMMKLTAGGSSNSVVGGTGNKEPLYSYTKAGNPTETGAMIANGAIQKANISGDAPLAYDSYGNIIDSNKMNIIIPYWQDLTISGGKFTDFMANTGAASGDSFPYRKSGEGAVTDDQLKSYIGTDSPDALDKATKMRNAMAQAGAIGSPARYISIANSAVGDSGDKLSDKAAAALALVIGAGTYKDIQQFNGNLLQGGQTSGQLYIGETIQKANDKSKGTYLYTITDLTQRIGLMTDFGMFDNLRKTIVSAVANAYNSSFLQTNQDDVFYTKVFGEGGTVFKLGLAPFYFAIAGLMLLELWTVFKYVRGKAKPGEFVSAFFKFIIVIVIALSASGINNWLLNRPTQMLADAPLRQQSVLDQYAKLKRQQTLNNVFYASLMGDQMGEVNNSTNYQMTFYTATTNSGNFDKRYADPLASVTSKATGGNGVVSAKEAEDDKKATNKGNGSVPFGATMKYKSIQVTSADLISWASEMTKQKLTATDANFAASTEATQPAQGYEPGKEPLFDWLAKNYKPIGQSGTASDATDTGQQSNAITGGQTDSSSSSSSSSSSDSSSSDSSSGDSSSSGSDSSSDSSDDTGDDQYGKKRNPADTSLKSAYKTNNKTGQIDNSAMYQGIDKYAEFAVPTKHIATDADKKNGIDKDSDGGSLTASQAFLALWQQVFYNSGQGGNPGDANSFTSLMNIGQAINGRMNGQVTSANVGQDNTGSGLTQSNVGSVGRTDLINELAMTKSQRTIINGGDGKFSTAAQQMIDTFQVPKPSSDYFNLDANGSLVDLMVPYMKGKPKSRAGYIYDINKKALNDYINIYSDVRASVKPTDSNSSSDTGNNQVGKNDVDPFTMAEDQVVALDIFFTASSKLGYSMFPKGYTPKTISIDSWNRMLYIPIGDMSKISDSAQYNDSDNDAASQVSLIDNTASYIGLQESIFTMLFFLYASYALLAFGVLMTILFGYVYPLLLLYSLFKFLFGTKQKGSQFKALATGALGTSLIMGALKAFIVGAIVWMNRTMNNAYAANDGQTNPSILMHALTLSVIVTFAIYVILMKYVPMLKKNLSTLGAEPGQGFLGGLAGMGLGALALGKGKGRTKVGRAWNKLYDKARHPLRSANAIRRSVAGHAASIGRKIKKFGGASGHLVARLLRDKKYQAGSSKGGAYFNTGKNTIKSRINDILNSGYGAIKKTTSGGLDLADLAGKGAGEYLGEVTNGKLKMDLASADAAKTVAQSLIAQGFDKSKISYSGKDLLLSGVNDKQLTTAGGRKEALDPMMSALDKALKENGYGTGEINHFKKRVMGVSQDGDDLSLPVNKKNGIDPKKLQKMLDDDWFTQNFKVLSTPETDASGRFANGTFKVQPLTDNANAASFENLAHKYTGMGYSGRYNANVAVGPDKESIAKGLLVPGMTMSNGNVMFDSSDPSQAAAAAAISSKIATKHDGFNNKLYDFMNGASSYVQKGDGHGFNTQFNASPNGETKRFSIDNPATVEDGIQGLRSMNKKFSQFGPKAAEAQNKFESGLLQSYNGPQGLVNAYQNSLNSSNAKTSSETLSAIDKFRATTSQLGPGGWNNASAAQKDSIMQSFKAVQDHLAQDGNLNMVQNAASSGRNVPGAREVSDLRERALDLAGSKPSTFNKMTLSQMSQMSANASRMSGYTVDDNGVFNATFKSGGGNNSAIQKSTADMLRNLS